MVAMEKSLMIRKFKLRELETERLRLNALRETDADKFFALKSDSIVTLPSRRLLERHGFIKEGLMEKGGRLMVIYLRQCLVCAQA